MTKLLSQMGHFNCFAPKIIIIFYNSSWKLRRLLAISHTCRRLNSKHHVLGILRELRRAFHAFENFQRYRPQLDLLADCRHDFLKAEFHVRSCIWLYLSASWSTFASSSSVRYRLFSLSFLVVSKIMSTVGGSLLPKMQDNTDFVDQQNFIFPVIMSLSLISL